MVGKAEHLLKEKVMPGIKFPCYFRISAKGVPHLVVTAKKTRYSVCYFGANNIFRIFYPYPSYDEKQTRVNCKVYQDVIKFFEDLNRGGE